MLKFHFKIIVIEPLKEMYLENTNVFEHLKSVFFLCLVVEKNNFTRMTNTTICNNQLELKIL